MKRFSPQLPADHLLVISYLVCVCVKLLNDNKTVSFLCPWARGWHGPMKTLQVAVQTGVKRASQSPQEFNLVIFLGIGYHSAYVNMCGPYVEIKTVAGARSIRGLSCAMELRSWMGYWIRAVLFSLPALRNCPCAGLV